MHGCQVVGMRHTRGVYILLMPAVGVAWQIEASLVHHWGTTYRPMAVERQGQRRSKQLWMSRDLRHGLLSWKKLMYESPTAVISKLIVLPAAQP